MSTMKTIAILTLLYLNGCNVTTAPETYTLKEVEQPAIADDAGAPAPVAPKVGRAAPHAPEPSVPTLAAVEAQQPPLDPNGCRAGQRDLGCACAPTLDVGDCDCRNKELCAKDCHRDSNGVANVDVFCVDGGI